MSGFYWPALLGKRRRLSSSGAPMAPVVKRTGLSSYAQLSRRVTRVGAVRNARYLYGRGVAGSSRNAYARIGREVPLYLPPHGLSSLNEAHYLDTSSGAMSFNTTGGIVHLNAIALGDDILQRHANRIMMFSVHVIGQVQVGATSVIPQGFWSIVYDRQPQGALPAITDIYATASTNTFQRMDTRDRFSILYRQHFQLEGNATTPTADSLRRVDRIIHMRRQAAYTTGETSGDIQYVKTGGLYLVWLSSNAADTTAAAGVLQCRVVFAP